MKIKLEELIRAGEQACPGPWYVATGCSWRRFLRKKNDAQVILPMTAEDGHPDLSARQVDLEFVEQASEYYLPALRALHELWLHSEYSDQGHVRAHGEMPSTLIREIIKKHFPWVEE